MEGASRPRFSIYFSTQICVKPYVPREPEGTQVIVGSVNMGYISDTARNRTRNLFRLKRELIPLSHSDGFEGEAQIKGEA